MVKIDPLVLPFFSPTYRLIYVKYVTKIWYSSICHFSRISGFSSPFVRVQSFISSFYLEVS